ncbi:hypothetical protein HY628_01680 [Candidatus Uhrbacteria bacterium]|nr:hypothetical protein [Candidatus Uhrbacteria bacterium]
MKKIFQKIGALAGCASIGLGLMFLHPAKASIVTSLTDTMSSQATSASANHTLTFVTRTGAAEGSTIAITFASSFDTSTIDSGDVDLAVGGTDRTLAANCSGAEQASVSVSSDVVTITICAGDGGAIAASSTVTIEIGTQATAGGTGNSQIANPGTAGTYTITVGGSFGDRGSLAVGITSPGGVAVSGTVATSSPTPQGGGGGFLPPGGGADSAAPIISNVQATNITETGADLTWTTDEPADSRVDYGLTVSYEKGSPSETPLVVSHRISLSSLLPDTSYHFRARSADQFGNAATSPDFSFRTLGPPDTSAPAISDLQVINLTGSSARVVWATNEPATSQVDYGQSISYELGMVEDGRWLLDHAIDFSNLTSETTYHARAQSKDAAGNLARSGDVIFTTLDITPPQISNLKITDITETRATVIWTTNESATSEVAYGQTNAYELGAIFDSQSLITHRLILADLTPATTYHAQARSRDQAGNQAQSTDQIFTTLPDRSPPANVFDFLGKETEPGTVQLRWNNPPDPDFVGVRIVRRPDRFAKTPLDGTVVFDGKGNETTDRGLTSGITFRYVAFAYDSSGNFASGALTQITIAPVCGDGRCTSGEDEALCPADCRAPTPAQCGNLICESTESQESCPADCRAPIPPIVLPPPGPVCGNQFCENGETGDSCPADCRQIAVPPVTVRDEERLTPVDLHLRVANQRLELFSVNGSFQVLKNTPLWVELNRESLAAEPTEVRLLLGSDGYRLNREAEVYRTAVMTQGTAGSFPLIISVIYSDGSADRLDATLVANPWGQIVARTDFDGLRMAGVAEANLTLFDQQGNLWNAAFYGQENPSLSDVNGSYAWYVPNGVYTLQIRKDGYREERAAFTVTDYLVRGEVELLPWPPLEDFRTILAGPLPLDEKILELGETLGRTFDYYSGVLQKDFLDNPQVEDIAEIIVAPALTVVSVVSAGAATAAVGIGTILRLISTQPLLFFSRRKRRGWGIVYNAISKVPVDLATVRLREAQSGNLVGTRVTDREGRYFFIVQPGTYRLEAQKHGFGYPSEYLRGATRDPLYIDLYHGEPIVVTEGDATIAANIPLDPEAQEQPPAVIVRKIWLRRLEEAVAAVSPVVAALVMVISPTVLTIALFVFQLFIYAVIRLFVKVRRPKGWGIVYNAETRQPLRRAIVRIFEPIYGKLLDTQVTDRRGRYLFLAGPNQYRVAAEKGGYQPTAVEIDYRAKKEPEAVKEDLKLRPEEKKEEWKSEPSP